jgi:hypothetical protein
MALLCRSPVPEAHAQLLHPFDATNTGSQIGAEKTAVGCLVRESAHTAKTQIDCSGSELTGFKVRAVTQNHDPVEGQARFRATPVNELIDGVTITPASRRTDLALLRLLIRMANSRQLSNPSYNASRPSHNYQAELLYQRRTRRARSVFQRLALPTSVSICNGICSE